MTKNPLTFKHIGNNVVLPVGPPIQSSPAGNNEVHNAGEVWCAALWEVFVNLVAKHGHADAEKRMLAYVIGGLKLTPIRPTFTQARDGIIAAVSALDAADLPDVKAGFAKRGMGTGAVVAAFELDVAGGRRRELHTVGPMKIYTHDSAVHRSAARSAGSAPELPPLAPGVSWVRFGRETLLYSR